VNFAHLLRISGERRKKETESKNDREPDQPHGHLGGDGWREFIRLEFRVDPTFASP
jgi:hypothetical protein